MPNRMLAQHFGVHICAECGQPVNGTPVSPWKSLPANRGTTFALTDEALSVEAATKLHKELLLRKAHAAELGEFYRTALARNLWRSQAELARDLHVSPASVSRAISAAALPAQVLALFREVGMPSARMVRALTELVETEGAAAIVANANKLLHLRLTPDEIFTRLCAGHTPPDKFPAMSVQLITGSRSSCHVRIDSPDPRLLIDAFPNIEAWVESCLILEASLLRRRKRSASIV
jgi:hypothetical protein